MELFLHAGNVIYVASYSVRDMLKLRVLTVLGIASLVGYYASFEVPLWGAIAWSALFTAINLYQIARLIAERRPVRLEPIARKLYGLAFARLSERAFKRLVDAGHWESAATDTTLARPGEPLAELRIMLEGKARIEVDGETVGELGPGQFIGEMSYLTGDPPNAGVIVGEGARYLAVPFVRLRELLARDEGLRATVQGIIGADLCGKLRRAAHAPG